MSGDKSKTSTKIITLGKLFEPFGPKIMVTHPSHAWCPPTDIFECAEMFIIKCAISGLHCDERGRIEGMDISIRGDTVAIRGNTRDSSNVQRYSVYQMEIHYGPFQCHVQINEPFDGDNVRVEYADGFLKVFVPKKA
jgi:HSP20 family protein